MTINEGILALPGFGKTKQVRVIGPTGEQLGNVSVAAALNIAYEKGLDLVLVAPQGNPPVCKVLDYGKFRFERDKKEKEARKNWWSWPDRMRRSYWNRIGIGSREKKAEQSVP